MGPNGSGGGVAAFHGSLAVLVLVVSVVLVLGGCTLGGDGDGDRPQEASATVVVPDVTSSRASDAFARLREAGLRVSIEDRFLLASNEEPIVIAERPAPGTRVRRDSAVVLTIQEGGILGLLAGSETEVEVPNVVGLPLSRATELLDKADLVWSAGRVPALSASAAPELLAAYRVRAQEPRAGARFQQVTAGGKGPGGSITPVKLEVRVG